MRASSMGGIIRHYILLKASVILVHATFPVAVFVISSSVTFKEIYDQFKRPWLLAKTFAVTVGLIPFITAGVVKLFEVPLFIAGVMLVAGASPGDSFALLEVKSKRGNVTPAAATMVLLCLAMPFTVPLWMWLFSGWFPLRLEVSPAKLFSTIASLTILPLLAGTALRTYRPSLAAALQRVMEVIYRVAIILVAVISLELGINGVSRFTPASLVSIFVVVSLAVVIGYYAGGAERKDRLSLALTASLGNLAVVVLVAHQCYPGANVPATAVVFVILRWAIIMLWYVFLKFRLNLRGEALN